MQAVGALPRAVWAVSRRKLNTPQTVRPAGRVRNRMARSADQRAVLETRAGTGQSVYDPHPAFGSRRLGLRDDRGHPRGARPHLRALERRPALPPGERNPPLQRALLRGRRDLQEDAHADPAGPAEGRPRRPARVRRCARARRVLVDGARVEPHRPADVALRVGGDGAGRRRGGARIFCHAPTGRTAMKSRSLLLIPIAALAIAAFAGPALAGTDGDDANGGPVTTPAPVPFVQPPAAAPVVAATPVPPP